MTSELKFDGRVAIVTGAGAGLGRAYALALARRGVKLVVNDLGGSLAGDGESDGPAAAVVAEIEAAGGTAIANGADVTDADAVAAMVDAAKAQFGRVDILINNAGILRDRSFAKMTEEDFRAVLEVHLMGAYHCTKAVWEQMRTQGFGRIVMTTSGSGLYGNFGQSNYAAAKMGLVGLMNVLAIEGAKYDIRVNSIAPTAATRMTEELIPGEAKGLLTPDSVATGVLALVHDDAPNRLILSVGAGGYAATRIMETDGIFLSDEMRTPEALAARLEEVMDMDKAREPQQVGEQIMHFIGKAMKAG